MQDHCEIGILFVFMSKETSVLDFVGFGQKQIDQVTDLDQGLSS